MFPGIYGFRLDAGHILFLGAFYTVVLIVGTTVLYSLLRTHRALRSGREPAIRWISDFHDLPARDRACRHALSGQAPGRRCERGFDCRDCAEHAGFGAPPSTGEASFELLGVTVPLDRWYSRGHSFVHAEADGTFTIGLDPIAERLAGPNSRVDLPGIGATLEVNQAAWSITAGEERVRVLCPVAGTVVAAGGPGWSLKLKPGRDCGLTHLLCAGEVRPWMQREVERLQASLEAVGGRAVMADGGGLIEDPGSAYEERAWAGAIREFFLEP